MDGKMECYYVEAGMGEGFENTMELKPMKYKEANNGSDAKAWEKEIEKNMTAW